MRLLAMLASLAVVSANADLAQHLFDPTIATKLRATYHNQSSIPSLWPQYTTHTGEWLYFGGNTWTTGFFPVMLYAMHERATLCPQLGLDASEWLAYGRSSSTGIIPFEYNNSLWHDVGFVSFPFQEELLVVPNNETAITAVNAFAQDLAARFNPVVGCTRSWDTADPTDFQVIIDNMMNLEIFFESEALTGNHTLRAMAISHADKTMVNHIRPDGSSYHVVDYNETTGVVFDQRTSQGYSDSSTWSRGQAWGIYGFAQMFRYTGFERYLTTARRMAKYFINNIPTDGVIPWDFNAPPTGRPADTSAAMIATNGLLLLAQQELAVHNRSGATYYQRVAQKILANTTAQFWAPASWQSLLSNGTVNNPAKNNLTGIVYGDYYFVRAGNELVKLGLATC